MTEQKGTCEDCAYYVYDEEYDEYFCTLSLDQDDMERLISKRRTAACPYYRFSDEYWLARKQK